MMHRTPLPPAVSALRGLLISLSAAAVLLGILAMAGAMLASALADRWQGALAGQATILIQEAAPGQDWAPLEMRRNRTVEMLEKLPEVTAVAVLKDSEIDALLKPYLGRAALPPEMRPQLIAIRFKGEMAQKIPETIARVDGAQWLDQEGWRGLLSQLAHSLRLFGFAIAAVILGLALIGVATGTRARIAGAERDIRLLHSLGAGDHAVAMALAREALVFSLIGVPLGLGGAFALGWPLSHAAAGLAGVFLPQTSFSETQLGILALYPVLICQAAAVTAYISGRLTLVRWP